MAGSGRATLGYKVNMDDRGGHMILSRGVTTGPKESLRKLIWYPKALYGLGSGLPAPRPLYR